MLKYRPKKKKIYTENNLINNKRIYNDKRYTHNSEGISQVHKMPEDSYKPEIITTDYR